ncbi:MAG: hypothetical protein AB7E52_03740 [Bdellovibrionales bacterium]
MAVLNRRKKPVCIQAMCVFQPLKGDDETSEICPITLSMKPSLLQGIKKLGLYLNGSDSSRYPGYAASYIYFLENPLGVISKSLPFFSVPLAFGRIYFGVLAKNKEQRNMGLNCEQNPLVVRTRSGAVYRLDSASDIVIGTYPQKSPHREALVYGPNGGVISGLGLK